MSQHLPVPKVERFDLKKAVPLAGIFKSAAGIGIVGSALTFIINTQLGGFAWLVGFMFFFTVLVGCFFWNCLHHATDTEWGVLVRRQIENLASLLRFIGVFFIPIACIILIKPGLMYGWLHPAEDDLLMAAHETKVKYLNTAFFWFRVVAFFGLLYWLSTILRKRSMAQDRDGAAKHTFVMRKVSVAGIPTLAIVLTFAGIDWLQALNHHWYSTMWGVYLFAGAAGASMALIILTCKWLQSLGYLKPVNEEHYHLMGKFLLAFTVFWAYIGFSQYMLITYANFEEETIYFRLRNTAGWNWLSMFLVFGRFFFMFVPLLFQGLKKKRGVIFCCAWILFMQFLDIFIIVMPELYPTGFSLWALIAAIFPWLGIAGCLGLCFLKHLGEGVTFPTKDPRLAESLKFSN
jgi:hypothetical protein